MNTINLIRFIMALRTVENGEYEWNASGREYGPAQITVPVAIEYYHAVTAHKPCAISARVTLEQCYEMVELWEANRCLLHVYKITADEPLRTEERLAKFAALCWRHGRTFASRLKNVSTFAYVTSDLEYCDSVWNIYSSLPAAPDPSVLSKDEWVTAKGTDDVPVDSPTRADLKVDGDDRL